MPNDPALTTAEQAVAAAWLAERGPRRGRLEQADIDAIAEAAFRIDGLKPSVELIRRIAGGGSPNTIHPKLDAWFRQARIATTPPPVPNELLSVWDRLQADAARAVHEELAPMRAALATEQQALASAREQLGTEHAALATERVTTERLVTSLREDFHALQAHNEALQEDLARLTTQRREAMDLIEQHETHLAELRTQLIGATDEAARLADDLAHAQADRQRSEDALAQAQTAMSTLETDITTLQASAAASVEALDQAQQEAASRYGELTAAQDDIQALNDRAEALEQAVLLAQTTASSEASLRDHLIAELAREREALASARALATHAGEALASGNATIEALRAENERWRALVPRRSAKAPSRRPRTDADT